MCSANEAREQCEIDLNRRDHLAELLRRRAWDRQRKLIMMNKMGVKLTKQQIEYATFTLAVNYHPLIKCCLRFNAATKIQCMYRRRLSKRILKRLRAENR